jgi:hypothetical protein
MHPSTQRGGIIEADNGAAYTTDHRATGLHIHGNGRATVNLDAAEKGIGRPRGRCPSSDCVRRTYIAEDVAGEEGAVNGYGRHAVRTTPARLRSSSLTAQPADGTDKTEKDSPHSEVSRYASYLRHTLLPTRDALEAWRKTLVVKHHARRKVYLELW